MGEIIVAVGLGIWLIASSVSAYFWYKKEMSQYRGDK